jgi:N-acetylneuraminic acid mutarotase
MIVGIANMEEKPTVASVKEMVFGNEKFTLLIKGEILSYGKNSDFFRQGFCWGTDSTNLADSFLMENPKAEMDTFSYELQNLNGNLTYYWRAIAKNKYGTALGAIQEYKTPSEEPSVISGENAAFPADGALIFTGEVTALGKITDIFEKGFCWGIDAENLTDTVFIESDSFGLGVFSYTWQNACGNTTYYWRAFAKNNNYSNSDGEVRTYRTPVIFETKGRFTGKQRSNFAVFTLKNSFYMTCGDNNSFLYSDIYRYDGNEWWSDLNNMPGNDRRYPVAFTINDSLAYVGTGQGINNSRRVSYGDFYIFNGTARTWTETPIATPVEMPRHEAVAFGLNNKGYVVGGHTEDEVFRDVWEYSLNSGTGLWKKINNFPTVFYGGICIYDKERVFAGFGNNIETENTLWEYDAVKDQWKEFAETPVYPHGGRAKIRVGVIIRDRIYMLDVINIIWELDLTTGEYKQKSALPNEFPPQNEQYMFSIGDAIYIGLGGTELFYRYYPFWDN